MLFAVGRGEDKAVRIRGDGPRHHGVVCGVSFLPLLLTGSEIVGADPVVIEAQNELLVTVLHEANVSDFPTCTNHCFTCV